MNYELYIIHTSYFLLHYSCFKKDKIMLRTIQHQNSNDLSRLTSSGSALIITIILISAISGIAFSVGRLMASEIRQSTQLEHSMVAYYAAESGIERGLLMWRYNHDVQVPIENIDNDKYNGMSNDVKMSWRINLSSDGLKDQNIIDDYTIPPLKRDNSYYDLRIWYKNPIIDEKSKEVVCTNSAMNSGICAKAVSEGRPVTNTYNKPALAKDQAVQYDVEGLEDIILDWEAVDHYYCLGTTDGKSNCHLEIIPIDSDGNVVVDFKWFLSYFKHKNVKYTLSSDTTVIRLRFFGNPLKDYSITVDNRWGAARSDPKKMSSRYTTIDSIGYFGLAKRRLQIKIDRFSGTIFGPSDFVIYQGE